MHNASANPDVKYSKGVNNNNNNNNNNKMSLYLLNINFLNSRKCSNTGQKIRIDFEIN